MGGKAKLGDEQLRVVTENRKARFHYTVEETLEAGLELLGSEVKALRQGTASLAEAYAAPRGQELYLLNASIGPSRSGSAFAPEPTRGRRLLLHREEIDRWLAKVRERGYSIIPLMVYFKQGRAKVRLGLCRGKTHGDRRQEIREREEKRELERVLRRG